VNPSRVSGRRPPLVACWFHEATQEAAEVGNRRKDALFAGTQILDRQADHGRSLFFPRRDVCLEEEVAESGVRQDVGKSRGHCWRVMGESRLGRDGQTTAKRAVKRLPVTHIRVSC
jgi:hypothetical protein